MKPQHKALTIIGWILTVLVSLMLLFSASMKFTGSPQLAEGFDHLGYPVELAVYIGVLEISCVVVYLIPPTAVLGAVLMTGYMGGAIATHVRVGEAFYVQVAIGVVVWLALYLRDPRVRALLPIRRSMMAS